MKSIKTGLFMLVFALALVVGMSADVPVVGVETVQAATVALNKTEATINKGKTLQLKVTGTKSKVTWATSKKDVATVDKNGKVTAKAKGTAKITATVGKKKYTCTVKVEEPKLNKKTIALEVDNTFTLKVSGSTQKITWASGDKNIATVTNKGVVTAVSEGTVNITAKVGADKYTCKVTVKLPTVDPNKIETNFFDLEEEVVAIVKNNHNFSVNLSLSLLFFDESGTFLCNREETLYCLGKGKMAAISFRAPTDANYDYLPYGTYTLKISGTPATYAKDYSGNITTAAYPGVSALTVEVTNTAAVELSTVKVSVIFMDAAGNVIGYEYTYAGCTASGSVSYENFNYPHDAEWNTIVPASSIVLVNEAYAYTW